MAIQGDRDIPIHYHLIDFRSNIRNRQADAIVTLQIDGEEKTATGEGNGMIDASVHAVNKLTGLGLQVSDYASLAEESGSDAVGMEKIQKIMDTLRDGDVPEIEGFKITQKDDKQSGKPFISETDKVARNVIIYQVEDVGETKDLTQKIKVTVKRDERYIHNLTKYSGIQLNIKIPDYYFEFKKPEGYEIKDYKL